MKKLLPFLLLTFLASTARSQSVDDAITRLVSVKLDSFKMTLDSISYVEYTTTNATPVFIDTLDCPDNSVMFFYIQMGVTNTATMDAGSSIKLVTIAKKNGIYSIVRNVSAVVYAGSGTAAKALWDVVISGGVPVIRITGSAATNFRWQFKRENL